VSNVFIIHFFLFAGIRRELALMLRKTNENINITIGGVF
jgi:hypothetical protein